MQILNYSSTPSSHIESLVIKLLNDIYKPYIDSTSCNNNWQQIIFSIKQYLADIKNLEQSKHWINEINIEIQKVEDQLYRVAKECLANVESLSALTNSLPTKKYTEALLLKIVSLREKQSVLKREWNKLLQEKEVLDKERECANLEQEKLLKLEAVNAKLIELEINIEQIKTAFEKVDENLDLKPSNFSFLLDKITIEETPPKPISEMPNTQLEAIPLNGGLDPSLPILDELNTYNKELNKIPTIQPLLGKTFKEYLTQANISDYIITFNKNQLANKTIPPSWHSVEPHNTDIHTTYNINYELSNVFFTHQQSMIINNHIMGFE